MNELIIEWADERTGVGRTGDWTGVGWTDDHAYLVSDRMILQTGEQSDQTDLLNNHRTNQQSTKKRPSDRANQPTIEGANDDQSSINAEG